MWKIGDFPIANNAEWIYIRNARTDEYVRRFRIGDERFLDVHKRAIAWREGYVKGLNAA